MQADSEILLLILVQSLHLKFTSWEKLTGFYPLAKHLQIFKNINADSAPSYIKSRHKTQIAQKFNKTKESSRQSLSRKTKPFQAKMITD